MNCEQKKQDKKNALRSFYGVLKTRTMQQIEKKRLIKHLILPYVFLVCDDSATETGGLHKC